MAPPSVSIFGAILVVAAILSSAAPALANTATCSCAVTSSGLSGTSETRKWTGVCTRNAGYVEPYSNYQCYCGPNDDVAPCDGENHLVYSSTAAATTYCDALYEDVDGVYAETDWNTYCIVYPGIEEPVNCGANNSVKIVYTLSTADAASTCTYLETRTECDACSTTNDTDADTDWPLTASITSTGFCDITDASANPWVIIDAACLTDDNTTLSGYEFTCGPLQVACVEQVDVNDTSALLTRIRALRSIANGWACDEYPAAQAYYGTAAPCVTDEDEIACDNATGIQTDVKRVIGTPSDHCRTVVKRDICTGATDCPEIARFDCVMEGWGDWSVCSSTCDGWRTRHRGTRYGAYNGGDPCPQDTFDRDQCNYGETCAAECIVADTYDKWGRCTWHENGIACARDPTVKLGWQNRTRDVTDNGTATCTESLHDFRRCFPDQCEQVSYNDNINNTWLMTSIGLAIGAVATTLVGFRRYGERVLSSGQ